MAEHISNIHRVNHSQSQGKMKLQKEPLLKRLLQNISAESVNEHEIKRIISLAKDNGFLSSICLGIKKPFQLPNPDESPLLQAISQDKPQIVQLFSSHGVDVNTPLSACRAAEGMTSVHLVAWYGNTKLMKKMCNFNPDWNQKDGQQQSPLGVAINKANDDMVSLIISIMKSDDEVNMSQDEVDYESEDEDPIYLDTKPKDPSAKSEELLNLTSDQGSASVGKEEPDNDSMTHPKGTGSVKVKSTLVHLGDLPLAESDSSQKNTDVGHCTTKFQAQTGAAFTSVSPGNLPAIDSKSIEQSASLGYSTEKGNSMEAKFEMGLDSSQTDPDVHQSTIRLPNQSECSKKDRKIQPSNTSYNETESTLVSPGNLPEIDSEHIEGSSKTQPKIASLGYSAEMGSGTSSSVVQSSSDTETKTKVIDKKDDDLHNTISVIYTRDESLSNIDEKKHVTSSNVANNNSDISEILKDVCATGNMSSLEACINENSTLEFHQAITTISDQYIIPVTKLFIQKGVDINCQDEKDQSLLMKCISIDNRFELAVRCRLVELLLLNGADPNIHDDQWDTPLHLATDYGFLKIVSMLLEHNADKNIINVLGSVPSDYCPDIYQEKLKVMYETIKPHNKTADMFIKSIKSAEKCLDSLQLKIKEVTNEDKAKAMMKEVREIRGHLERTKYYAKQTEAGEPSDIQKAMRITSEMIGHGWKDFFRYIYPGDDVRASVHIDEIEASKPGKLREQAMEALTFWYKQQGRNATPENLRKTLRQMGKFRMITDEIENKCG